MFIEFEKRINQLSAEISEMESTGRKEKLEFVRGQLQEIERMRSLWLSSIPDIKQEAKSGSEIYRVDQPKENENE
jgi:hypothetical protein